MFGSSLMDTTVQLSSSNIPSEESTVNLLHLLLGGRIAELLIDSRSRFAWKEVSHSRHRLFLGTASCMTPLLNVTQTWEPPRRIGPSSRRGQRENRAVPAFCCDHGRPRTKVKVEREGKGEDTVWYVRLITCSSIFAIHPFLWPFWCYAIRYFLPSLSLIVPLSSRVQ